MDLFDKIMEELKSLVDRFDIGEDNVSIISARPLSPQEAIGNPERKDFPLLKGKEFMMEATFRESRGQAYTDMPNNYYGLVKDILSLKMANNFGRAVFISTLNAVMRHLGLVEGTVHCRNNEPGECAQRLPEYIGKTWGNPRVALIGLQPALAEQLSMRFSLRITDIDEGNVGKKKFGIVVEGPGKTEVVISWCDVVLATGSTAVNGTIQGILTKKPIIFYGVTISGIAKLCGYQRYCPNSH